MSRKLTVFRFVWAFVLAAVAPAWAQAPQDASTAAKAMPRATDESTWVAGPWQPPEGLKQIPIWPGAAPDLKPGVPAPERVEIARTPDALHGTTSEAAWDVSRPTLTVFPPKGKNAGVGVIVFPGGGFRAVVVTKQGTEICDWLTSQGITCFLLKYRVPARDNHHWPAECPCFPLQDAQRAIRLVRAQAEDLHLDPAKIGVMGFSAGGFLVAQTSNIVAPAYKPIDATDTLSSRPDFAIAFYPGHLCRQGDTLEASIKVTKDTPPTFLLQAWDDDVDPVCNSTLYARALNAAGVPAEVHLFARGGHAFGLRRMDHPVVGMWPGLLKAWLVEMGVLAPVVAGAATGSGS